MGTRIVTTNQNDPIPRRAMSNRTPPMSALARSAKPTMFVSHTRAIANPSRVRSASNVITARTLVEEPEDHKREECLDPEDDERVDGREPIGYRTEPTPGL